MRGALFKHLLDVAKNNFLQLKASEPYSTGRLHDLCIEMISRHEPFMATLTDMDESANVMLTNRPRADEKFEGEAATATSTDIEGATAGS